MEKKEKTVLKSGKYRKSKRPKNKKPTFHDLKKKHRITTADYFYCPLSRRGKIYQLLEKTSNSLTITKRELMRQAVIHYCLFIESKLKDKTEDKEP